VGAVSVYLDANVIVPLFAVDPLNNRAQKALRRLDDSLILSDFSVAEFSSVMARRVRMRILRAEEARTAFSNFDIWRARHARLIRIESIDISSATDLIRRLDLSLRTPDALHIALIRRIGCKLLTFDKVLAGVAQALGLEVIKS
jgi:predicted nucleic acid-binding protein